MEIIMGCLKNAGKTILSMKRVANQLKWVQKRNIEALHDIISENEGNNIVIGTHGTALSTILNYYNSDFGCKDFLRIIDWMPYIVELDFENDEIKDVIEHCYIKKIFMGKERADKK